MGLKQDIAGAEVYMARANRRIGKARHADWPLAERADGCHRRGVG